MKELSLLLFLTFCYFSCTEKKNSIFTDAEILQNSVQIVDLSEVIYDNENAKLSDFVEDISYISLSDNNLIGDISQLYFADGKFFIRYGTSVQIFSSDGSYIKPLFKNGNGPGEAICLERFTFNEEQKVITFPAFGKFLYNYDFEGNFIKRESNEINNRYKKIIGYQDSIRFYSYSAPTPIMGESSNIYGDTLIYGENIKNNSLVLYQENPCKDVKVTYHGIIAELENADFVIGRLDSCFWYRNLFMDTLYVFNAEKQKFSSKYVFKLGDNVWDLETYMHLYYMDKEYLRQADSKTFLQEFFLGKKYLIYKLKKSGKKAWGYMI